MSLSLTSVNSILGLLNTTNLQIREKALIRLKSSVDSHWSEIAEEITRLEEIFEDRKNPTSVRQLAAFISSQVYFHLTEYEESLKFALQSGALFNLADQTQYTQTLINKCIDECIRIRKNNYDCEKLDDQIAIPQRYEEILHIILKQALNEKEYNQALGIAFETRNIQILEEIFKLESAESQSTEFFQRVLERTEQFITNRKFQEEVLRITADYYLKKRGIAFKGIDYLNVAQIYFILNDFEAVAGILHELITGPTSSQTTLIAYQIALQIADNENNNFIEQLTASIPVDGDEEVAKRREKLCQILQNQLRDQIYSLFLTQFAQIDPLMLSKMKDGSENKKCIKLVGLLLSQGILNAYTGDDKFLNDQKDWLKEATLWNKFMLVATPGLIHRGTKKDPKVFLNEYLPDSTVARSIGKEYQNGGALFGMGLYYFGQTNQELVERCIDLVRNMSYNQTEQIVHGASFALGMTALATQDATIREVLFDVLNFNNACTGEAAALAIGLLMAGSGDELTVEELISFAKKTLHEKIVRSISVAIALIYFGQSTLADKTIARLSKENDYVLRYSACHAIGMAYVGTNSNSAIRLLLQISSEDVSDDVRRAAVISLAFVMLTVPEQIPQIMKMLQSSYNQHVRYGCALALGIGCAGSCDPEAIKILETLLQDPIDFVRQGAFIGYSMVLQNYNNKFDSNVESLRQKLEETSFTKKTGSFLEEIIKKAKEGSPSTLSPVGAKLGLAILEAGGRNIGISLASQSGYPKLGACVSMLIFSHHWYWYPLVMFLPLSMTPNALIGIDEDFWVPINFKFQCNSQKSLFDYPPFIKNEENQKEKTEGPVQLSTTVKVTRRRKRGTGDKEGGEGNEGSFIENSSQVNTKSIIHTSIVVNPEEQQNAEKPQPTEPEEPSTHILQNPSKVVQKQAKHIQFIENRYVPVVQDRKIGIIFLNDTDRGKYDQYLNGSKGEQMVIEQPPIEAPEDFIFDEKEQNDETKKLL